MAAAFAADDRLGRDAGVCSGLDTDRDALRRLRVTLPFALRGIDTDNGLPSKSRERHETELLSADADVSTSNASPSGSHRRGITR
jgi:hypothetical protein